MAYAHPHRVREAHVVPNPYCIPGSRTFVASDCVRSVAYVGTGDVQPSIAFEVDYETQGTIELVPVAEGI